MCISFFVCFFLECLWSSFSKVCLSHLSGSLVSFFSVSHFLFCSWEWSVPCLCSPRPGSSFPLFLCVTSGCFVLISCPAYLSFFLFVNWLFVILFPSSFDILPFSDSTVSTLSWLSLPHVLSASLGPFTLFFHALCASVSLCFLWFFHFTSPLYSRFFSAFPLLLTFGSFSFFMSLCLPLLDVLYSSLLAYFLCMCVFAHVCMFVTKGLLSPF